MRAIVLAAAALALASCDNSSQPPAGSEPLRPSTEEVAANEVLLNGQGLTAGPEAFYFAAGQKEVEAAVARALGKASDSGTNEECGAGPVDYSSFPGGLTVNFQNGSLVGWFWGDEAENISLEGGISIGAPRSEIEAEEGFAPIGDSTLGEEFSLGDRIGGFFEGDRLSVLYAGTQCFFR